MSTVTQPCPAGFDQKLTPTAAWDGFVAGPWTDTIDVRDFLQRNYTPYTGEADFLAGPTERTAALWQRLTALFPTERERGVYDIDATTPATITAPRIGSFFSSALKRTCSRRCSAWNNTGGSTLLS